MIDFTDPRLLGFAIGIVILLIVALFVLTSRRRRLEQRYLAELKDREERLKMALWGSAEQYWDYDLVKGELRRMRADDARSSAEISIETSIETDHRIHEEDLPQVLDALRRHIRGETELFLSEHRILNGNGSWIWMRARGRTVERDANGHVRSHRRHRAQHHHASQRRTRAPHRQRGVAQHERGGLGVGPRVQLRLGQSRVHPDHRLQRYRSDRAQRESARQSRSTILRSTSTCAKN